ncbi:hypothetical protein [Novosphingobium aerophilum]|uniref:Uncharacterized protein n=1 Tax=Novosphingobium aerophilum TaxID=2839843 RepID=A0A7X1FAX7_9SPHN|nr:hypothetical protein [Novosphingobium aerophilum]MBC2653625.1 hypothetical protein [Novosphingobium aerophilum]
MNKRSRPAPSSRSRIFLLYAMLVTGVLTWQGIHYTGLLQILGEWQFSKIGTFFPVATQFVLVLAATLPVVAWLRFRDRRNHSPEPTDGLTRARERSARLVLLYTVVASCLAMAALVTMAIALTAFLPHGPSKALSVEGTAPIASGPVRLRGYADKSRMIEIKSNVIAGRRTIFVVPLLAYPGDRREIGYFVPVVSSKDALNVRTDPAPTVITQGFLAQHGMPEEAASLLRARGYPVRHRAALLYRSPADAAWSGLTSGILIGLLAMLFAIGAMIETRRYGRLVGSANATTTVAS